MRRAAECAAPCPTGEQQSADGTARTWRVGPFPLDYQARVLCTVYARAAGVSVAAAALALLIGAAVVAGVAAQQQRQQRQR